MCVAAGTRQGFLFAIPPPGRSARQVCSCLAIPAERKAGMSDSPASHLSLPMSERPTVDISVETRPSWRQWLIDRNPCFLLSGVCMLLGCFLISREIHQADPGSAGFVLMLVGLIVVMNIYEAAVIGMGLWLSRSQALVRDSRHLLGLALLLLIDAAFVYQETATADPWLGGTIAGLAGVLGIIKLLIIMRGVGVSLPLTSCVAVSLALIGLYALPVLMRLLAGDGFVSMPAMMGVWAAVGLVIAGYALPISWATRQPARDRDHQQLQCLIMTGGMTLPLLALCAHGWVGMWVYGNGFTPAFLSPIILGVAAIMLRQHARLGGTRPTARAVAVMVGLALGTAMSAPAELVLVFDGPWPSISPLRGSLLVSAVLLAWAWALTGGILTAFSAASLLFAALLGHTHSAIWHNAGRLVDWLAGLLPDDRLGWGVLAVAVAFVLLALGGGLGWKRERATRERAGASDQLITAEE